MKLLSSVTARVPAKVNLQLTVGPRRTDGYHDVVTVYHAISLFDEITVSDAERDSVVITGEGADLVPADATNLAARAAAAVLAAAGPGCREAPGTAIQITKRIPVAAGLAGGSADAAGALVACNELWGTGLSDPQLAELAAHLGSDVAFALAGATAIGSGRGERLTRALAAGSYHWVLAFAETGLSTADVYAACDRIRAARSSRPVPAPELDATLMTALRAGDPARVGAALSNDLQAAAVSLLPALRRALAAGTEQGALGSIVSGSGPTCAYLARDASHAARLAAALAGAGICRTLVRAVGPAPGATLVAQS